MLPVSPLMGVHICVIGTDGHVYMYLCVPTGHAVCWVNLYQVGISSDSWRNHVHFLLLWLESMSTTLTCWHKISDISALLILGKTFGDITGSSNRSS